MDLQVGCQTGTAPTTQGGHQRAQHGCAARRVLLIRRGQSAEPLGEDDSGAAGWPATEAADVNEKPDRNT